MSQPKPSIQIVQIIGGSLIFAVIAFALVAVVVRTNQQPAVDPAAAPQQADSMITLLAMGMVAMTLMARPFVLGAQDRSAAQKLASIRDANFEQHGAAFLGAFQTRTIISLAMLEGPAFFAGIAYIIEGHWVSLALMGFQVLIMLAAFPTEQKFQTWFDNCRMRSSEYTNTNASS